MADPRIKLTEDEEVALNVLLRKYGKNYKKMMWDRKLNTF